MLSKAGILAPVAVAIIWLSAATARADHPGLREGDANYYQTVASWFTSGTPVAFADIRGSWAGRCFEKWYPSDATNIEMVTHEVMPSGDLGPGFPNPPTVNYVSLLIRSDGDGRALPSDAMDNSDTSSDQQVVAKLVDAKTLSKIDESKGTVQWSASYEAKSKWDTMTTVRKYDSWWVAEISNLTKGNTLFSAFTGQNKTGQAVGPFQYCYFFKKLN